jgi:hypoxanthine phosphoribosyltransferase
MLIGVYPETSKRTGVVKIIKDLDIDVEGRHVIMIEDIINTGLTMGYLVQNIESRKPASIKICTLLDRRVKRLMNIPLEYTGFVVPDIYLVGYGLDYEQEYRHLPYIAEFDIDKYNKIKDRDS